MKKTKEIDVCNFEDDIWTQYGCGYFETLWGGAYRC